MRPVKKISFLIPAYNEAKLIGRAIASVKRSCVTCEVEDYEVIVCDNASMDETAALARATGVQVIYEAHRQIARARNAAAAASEGAWLLWMDADAILSADALRKTLLALESGKVCGGGAQVQLEGIPLGWHVRSTLAAWNWMSGFLRLAAGSYFFALREGWEETGGFNEGVYAGEEVGFARNLGRWGRARGLQFVTIDAVILSSARKITHFSVWRMVRLMLTCAWPGNLGRRDRCAFWYDRNDD